MSTTHRFQLDLAKEELDAIDRLGQLTKLRTKKEVVQNALTLFRWAVKEVACGRTICSIDDETDKRTQLELPALSIVADVRARNPLLPAEEYLGRAGAGRSVGELLEHLKGLVNAEVETVRQ